tara:strand:+ start:5926 stop:6432 length:507 start_codon:yes stop_codon:yes gene_type:complete
MADFGSRNSGFFGGTSSGGGGGTSTGINGLNGTTNIGLGGTMTGNTTIDVGQFTLFITNAFDIFLQSSNGSEFCDLSIKNTLIETTFNSGFVSVQEGIYLDFFSRQYVFGGGNASITCDATNDEIIFNTKSLNFDGGTALEGAFSAIPSAISLVITLNNVPYKINLYT